MNKLAALMSRDAVRNEDGATIIEYALLAGLIAVVSITVIGTVGTDVLARFTAIAAGL